jgi:hypothetical protein
MTTTTPSSNQTKFCSNCGKPLTGDGAFCSSCGYKIVDSHGQPLKKTDPIIVKLPKVKGFRDIATNPVVVIIATIAALIVIIGFCIGTTTLSGLLRGNVTHHGAFIKQFLGYKEIPTITWGSIKNTDWSKFPSLSNKPTILLWTPQIDLSNLGLSVFYPDGSQDNVQFDETSDGQYWNVTPSSALKSGNLYCYIAGNMLLTPDEIAAWCFTVH